MRISITGRHNKVSNDEMRRAAHFYARQLFTPKLRKQIKVNLSFDTDDAGFMGWCEWEDKKSRPREFNIAVCRRLGRRTALKILAHEMVHAMQYAKGNMQDVHVSDRIRWHGKNVNLNRTDYWDLPWEVEAYGRELGLLLRYENWATLRGMI